jgi:hypothetical protein
LHGGVRLEGVALGIEPPLALNEATASLALGLLRGSGPKVISVPSTPGPPIAANSLSVMPSPEIMMVFMPWSRICLTRRPPSMCRPPHIT